jgi:hypothetical protein
MIALRCVAGETLVRFSSVNLFISSTERTDPVFDPSNELKKESALLLARVATGGAKKADLGFLAIRFGDGLSAHKPRCGWSGTVGEGDVFNGISGSDISV